MVFIVVLTDRLHAGNLSSSCSLNVLYVTCVISPSFSRSSLSEGNKLLLLIIWFLTILLNFYRRDLTIYVRFTERNDIDRNDEKKKTRMVLPNHERKQPRNLLPPLY